MAVDNRGLSDAKRALLAQRLRGNGTGGERAVERRHLSGPAPLSVTQEELWYFSQLAPGSPVYNDLGVIRKAGPFALDAFRRAFKEIIRRHEIWRTTFELAGGEPVQVVHEVADVELRLLDLSTMPRADADQEAARLAAESARRPYQLDRLPLLRPLLVRFAEDDHRLYLANHLLVADGVSMYRIVLPELIVLYDAFASGREPALPEPPLQYTDYAAWSQQWTQTEEYARRMRYWRKRLQTAPLLQLPLDRPRPPRLSFRGAMERLQLSPELAGRLRALSSQENATLFQVLAAAFAVLLHRYAGGQEDIVFAVASDLRPRPELESVVGYCVAPLVLRVDVSGEQPFLNLLRQVRADLLDGLGHQVPFGRLVRELRPDRDAAINPVFQAMLSLEPPVGTTDQSWSLHQMDPELGNVVGCAKVDLELEFDESPEGHVDGRLIFNTDVFDVTTARRMIGHWHTLLEGIVSDPSRRVSELPLQTEGESRQLAVWNATHADYPRDVCLHHLVTAQAQRTPDAVALVFKSDQLTYGELERRANQVARRLQAAKSRGSVVAICVERSLDMVVGMLGILKSGAAYLPLDHHYPSERLAFVLEDSGAAVLLTHSSLRTAMPGHRAEVVCLDDPLLADGPDHAPESEATAGDLAYLLYTSGSTGKPKGVCVPHRAVVNLLTSMARQPGMTRSDTMLAVTTYAFDIAVVELWLPLVTGARVVIAPGEVASDGRRLARLITEVRPTVMQATPSGWQTLIDAGWEGRPNLVALCGGEALPPQLAASLLKHTAALWNMYGPTETTVWSTMDRVVRGSVLTIGRPIDNTTVHVLDHSRQPVPIGVPGELWIGGDGVACGYHNRPEQTAERFQPAPLAPGSRLYRTGDQVRLLGDGRIQYIGRLDHQVKVRGFRIELGEIETTLLADPRIASALVVARDDTPGDRRLVAYLVCAAGEMIPTGELQARLRQTLPDYMVPSAFVAVDHFPLTPNGKVDRCALPQPDWRPASTFVSPRSATEAEVASVWARTLRVDKVGVDDNFFELGGHSLLAVRLLVNVQREMGVAIPLAAFFDGRAMVAGMAAVIDATRRAGGNDASVEPALSTGSVPVRLGETAPVLFFVHADESSMLTLRHFLAPLGPDTGVLGLLPERVGHRFDRSRTVEDLAETMLRTVRETQPRGPYYVAGYSFGGLLAYELASRLRAADEEVAWLGMLDCQSPALGRESVRRALSMRERVARQRQRGLGGSMRKTAEVVHRELRAALVRLHLRPSRPSDDFDWRGAFHLATRYRCPGNDAPMDLFRTKAAVDLSGSGSLGWEDVHHGALRTHTVPGEHLTMVTEPHVSTLAEMVSSSLRDAVRATQAS